MRLLKRGKLDPDCDRKGWADEALAYNTIVISGQQYKKRPNIGRTARTR
jgi:hypothetical protein